MFLKNIRNLITKFRLIKISKNEKQKIRLTLLSTLLISCVSNLDPKEKKGIGLGAGAGIVAGEIADKIIETIPKYVPELKLPAIELCFFKDNKVMCKLLSCKEVEDCTRAYNQDDFVFKNLHSTFLIKADSLNRLLANIQIYCDESKKCERIYENYKDIDTVFIY